MTIYEAKGFQSNLVYPFDKIEPFQYIERFKPLVVPEGADIEEYKRTQAPYCISGKVTPEKHGSYKRNNSSLIYRDLIIQYHRQRLNQSNRMRQAFHTLQGQAGRNL